MAGIPQVITEDRASGAQVIKGSLNFDPTANGSDGQRLERTPTLDGNRRTWTWSSWIKRGSFFGSNDEQHLLDSRINDDDRFYGLAIAGSGKIFLWEEISSGSYHYHTTTSVFRDTGWYHLVVVVDTTQSTAADRVKFYVNGEQQDVEANNGTYPYYAQNYQTNVNQASSKHFIGSFNDARNFSGSLSQVYLIDGQALGPENFGYTDPLTNTWRPKKFTGEFSPRHIDNWNGATTGTGFNSSTVTENAFDGNPDTQAAPGQNGTMSFTPAPAITGISKIRIKARRDAGQATDSNFTLNGTTIGNLWTAGNTATVEITTLGGSPITQLTNLTWKANTNNNEWFGVYQIEVYYNGAYHTVTQGGINDFYLPMDGNSPIGEDKSGIISANDGTNWSSYFTGNYDSTHGWGTTYQDSNAFDGNLSTAAIGQVDAAGLTWTAPGGGIGANATTIRIYGNDDACPDDYLKINGINYGGLITQGFGPDWTVLKGAGAVGGGITQLESVYLRDNSSGNTHYRWRALEIDGVVLTDGVKGNSWTPVKFGGSVELSKATGAIPILNTNDAGTVAKPGVRTDKKTYTVTASGGKYYLDGVLTPTLNFLRGGTYIFDYTAASGHPFKFSTTSDGTHGGGSEYTDGTNTSTTNVMKITVPHNAPDTLYYYCSAHSGMGSSINVTTDVLKADPYAWKCVLAMPLVGGSADESANINVNSSAKTFVVQGNTAARTVSNYYGSSLYFDGSGDYLGATSNADFAMGTGDFTLECWVYRDSAGGFTNFMATRGAPGSANGYTFGAQSNGNGNDIEFYTNVLQLDGGSQTITNKKWHHVAITRSGNMLSSYVNGILNTTALNSQNFSNTSLAIAMTNDGSQGPLNGYLQDVRAYKGVAKYTENFVVGSTAPDVLPDTPSGITGKTNLSKITEGAVAFDGDGDYLSIGTSSDFDMDGDFTAEAWVYPTSHANDYAGIFGFSHDSDQAGWNVLVRSGSGRLHINVDMTYTDVTGSLSLNKWTHLALVRSGTGSGNCKLYIDGVADPTTLSVNNTTGTPSTTGCYIGSYPGYETAREFTGFISNARVIKGTALYTSNFTPPTEPLTAVTNTKLLCCQSNTQPGTAAVSPNVSGSLNTGTQWSHYVTTTQGSDSRDFYTSGYDAVNMFNGSTSNFTFGGWIDDSDDASDLIFRPPSGISVSSKLEVYVGYYDKIKVNGSTYNTGGESTNIGWVTVSDGSNFTGTINELILENTTNANVVRCAAIRIDDTTVLIDPVSPYGDASATNFNPFTDDINAIRGQETGYATLNPLNVGGPFTLSDGNLKGVSSGAYGCQFSTMGVTSGKWYAETTALGTGSAQACGIARYDHGNTYAGNGSSNFAYAYLNDGRKVTVGDSRSSYGATWATIGDTIGIAFDADNGTVRFYKNGVDQGIAFSTIDTSNGKHYFCQFDDSNATNSEQIWNFGQKPFKFPPPDGFQPVNLSTTQPEKVIARSDQYVAPTLYTGNGGTLSVNNLNFKPDLIWQKGTTVTGSFSITGHSIHDTVRGKDGTYYKELSSNTANAENVLNNSLYGGLSDITNNGFTVVDGSDSTYKTFNGNGNQYVAWCWKAGGSKNTFNIDDVGYANASDVNMNIGALNSSTYDQSQTWSTYGSFTSGTTWNPAVGTLFNHSLTSGPSLLAGNTGTWTFTSGITASKSIEIYTINGSNSNQEIRLTVDGTVHAISGSGNTWINTGLTGSLTAITIHVASGYGSSGLRAIKVDGKELVDAGVTVTNSPSIAATGSSVGTKQGFSIVSYTGAGGNAASIPHGLKQSPEFVIIKNLDGGTQGSAGGWWAVFHSHIPQGAQQLYSFNTSAATDSTWNNHGYVSGTNSSVVNVSIGDHSNDNTWWTHNNNTDYIMYAWHSVPGLQKFGEYAGSGNDDGTFIECGFRPAILWIKSWNTNGQEWVAYDSKRTPSNTVNKYFYLDQSIADQTGRLVDFVSNGFKFRQGGSGATDHGSSRRYIYMAWAEVPTINLYGGYANAR